MRIERKEKINNNEEIIDIQENVTIELKDEFIFLEKGDKIKDIAKKEKETK